jgi:hypothetical protein
MIQVKSTNFKLKKDKYTISPSSHNSQLSDMLDIKYICTHKIIL